MSDDGINDPSSNDEVIRVIYQAVADYSQLIAESKKAQEQTRALKKDLDGLAGESTHTVKVTADTAQAKADIAAALRDIVVKVKVAVDAVQAKADIAAVLKDATIKARVVVDAVAAQTELARVLRDVIVKARVVVDAVAAKAEIAAATKDTQVKVKITTDQAGLASLSAALARIKDLSVKVTTDTDPATIERLRDTLGQLRDLAVNVAVNVDAGALDALREQLARLRDLAITVAVRVDAAALAALQADLARLHDLAVTVAVRLDDTGVRRQLQALIARLRGAGPIDIAVRLKDDDVAAKLAALRGTGGRIDLVIGFDEAAVEARFAALIARLQAMAVIRVRTVTSGGPGAPGGGGSGGGGGSDKSKNPIPEWLNTASGLVLKFLPLIALAVPAAAGLVAIVGNIGATFVAAGAGAAIFAVAAVGAFSKATAAVQAWEKSGTIPTGPVAQVVKEFEQLKTRYSDLQKATQGPVFDIFDKGLQIAYDLLGKVQPLIEPITKAIGGAVDQIGAAVDGNDFSAFLSFVGAQAPHAITQLTTGMLGFGGGMSRLLEQFAPFIDKFVDGFARVGTEFDRWAGDLGSNTGFQKFLGYAEGEVPKLVALFINAWNAAKNLAVGLAPVGDALLNIVNQALKFIASLPPKTITDIAVALLAIAVAVKTVGAVVKIVEAFEKFAKVLSAIKDAAETARAGMLALGITIEGPEVLAAVAAVAAAYVIYKAVTDDATDAQKRNAQSAKDQQKALADLAQQIADSGGDITTNIRKTTYEALQKRTFSVGQLDASDPQNQNPYSKGGTGGNTTKSLTATMNLPQAAAYAGVDPYAFVSGATGTDQAAYEKSLAQFDKYLAARKQKLKTLLADPNSTPAQVSQVEADIAIVGDARDAYAKLGGAQGTVSQQTQALTAQQKAEAAAIGDSTDATTSNTAALDSNVTAAQAAASVKHILATTDFSSDASTTNYNNAVSAMQAYDQQLQTVQGDTQSLADAQYSAAQAQKAVTEARLAAIQQIKDEQRALRDLTLDEAQAKLSSKEADLALQKAINSGASADEIEQARIDDERAHNAVNDLEQDKSAKKAAAQKVINAGVSGNQGLLDAEHSAAAAQRQIAAAQLSLSQATTQLTDLHLAFDTAASKLGLTEGAVRSLKTNMDALKNKQIKVILDTDTAQGKLSALLQTQYAIELLAQHPTWTMAQALAAAAILTPHAVTSTPSKASPDPKNTVHAGPDSLYGGYAEGGPTVSSVASAASAVTAGAVHGPGTGTSDSIRVQLPVGGPAALSRGEHIVTDAEVQAAPGGHAYLEAFRAGLRARRPWTPPAAPVVRFAVGGAAVRPGGWPAAMPTFRAPPVSVVVPGYAAGGPARADRLVGVAGAVHNRSLTVQVGSITNAVPETAGTSLYRQVRRAFEGEER